MKRIVIIGGGISGLAAAHRLLERSAELMRPIEIVLLESTSRLGGVIQTEFRDGFLLERGPDCFISEKPEAINLALRLGIDSRLIPTNKAYRRSFVLRKGRLRAVPEGFHLLAPSKLWSFLTSDILSLGGKARMAADLVLPRKMTNGTTDESLAHFVRRRLGNEALVRMAQPMVGGIYTADPEKLSLRATFPRFLQMEAEHRSIILAMLKARKNSTADSGTSGARYGLFLSFDRGMQVLIDSLREKITHSGSRGFAGASRTTIQLNTTVEALHVGPSGHWAVKVSGGETLSADGVCLAIPAYVAARLLARIAPTIASSLAGISFASTATVNLAYSREDIPHPLDGFGFVVPIIEKRSLIACTFSSMKFLGRAPRGGALLRAFVGGALQPEMFELNPSKMIARVRADLRDIMGIEEQPLFADVSKWTLSMPQYEVGHLKRVEQIKAETGKFPGLKIANNSFSGAGIPDCIRAGQAAADEMIQALS